MKKCMLVWLMLAVMLPVFSVGDIHKLTNHLQEVYNHMDDEELVPLIVKMKQQYCPGQLYEEVQGLTRRQRRAYTVQTLQQFSERTQQDVKETIVELAGNNQATKLRYLWIANVIGMHASKEAINVLKEHPDVKKIDYDPGRYALEHSPAYSPTGTANTITKETVENSLPDNQSATLAGDTLYRKPGNQNRGLTKRAGQERAPGSGTRNISYNVEMINAPDVWELGYSGEGVTVAVLDTGINYNHHDIREQMWEHPDFPHHGYNFVDNDYDTMDRHYHGTHCAGTVAGNGASGTRTGVAPDATIMAVKVLGDDGGGEYQMLMEGMQYSVEYGADLMSISLGWTNVHNVIRAIFRDISQNVLSAGVLMSKSAGNRGGGNPPNNVTVPGDCPPPWLSPDQEPRSGVSAVFTVGATDSEDNIATFSSRGPVTWQDVEGYNDYPYQPEAGLLKPDISAPGVDVLSLSRAEETGYREASGTSMATPAVAGVMALMLSKNANLLPEDIGRILEETSVALTETKSNIFGSGRVDALAAVQGSSGITLYDYEYTDDNNDIPEYGETGYLDVSLINISVQVTEEPVEATLTTDDDYIEIVQDRADFGIIEPDSIVTVNEAFTIRIADDIPHEHTVTFSLNTGINDEHSWRSKFEMKFKAPLIEVSQFLIHDPEPGGNANGFIDPGEELYLSFPIKNKGGSDSPPARFSITGEDDLLEITAVSDTLFGSILSEEIVFPRVKVSVSEDIEPASIVPLTYQIESGEYFIEGQYNAVVGGGQLGSGESITGDADPSPINLFYTSLRGQTVYTKEELNKAGIMGETPLTGLGYYVASSPEYALPEFIIRVRHTTAEDASEHDDGPFETVFTTDNYNPLEGIWDVLSFDTPFLWNGRDNLLVDTAFSIAENWSETGQVKIYEAKNGFRYTRRDNPDQTDQGTTDVADYKPQAVMIFNTGETSPGNNPQNLRAQLVDQQVHLQWEAPAGGRRDGNKTNRLRSLRAERSPLTTRNPDGYNVYKNGRLLNEEPLEETEYIDVHYDEDRRHFYYVTALYEEVESPSSNIAHVELLVDKPEFSTVQEKHYEPFLLNITCDTPEASIYYTLDGSEPTEDDYLYEEPLHIEYHAVVKARAFKPEWQPSEIKQARYYILYAPGELTGKSKVNAVKLSWEEPWSPGQRNDAGAQSSRLRRRTSPAERNEHREKLDRRKQRLTSARDDTTEKYLTGRASLKGYNVYRSVDQDSFKVINQQPVTETTYTDSELPPGKLKYYVTALYEVGESLPGEIISLNGIVANPQFSKDPGEYEKTIYLSITTETPEAVIYYTEDGSKPDETSSVFLEDEPLQIASTTVIKTYAVKEGWQDSEIVTGKFINLSTGDDVSPLYHTELLNAYPNPFNPQTVIEFTLSEKDYVKIEIYNIAGQLVRTLFDETAVPGRHRIVWQGDNYRGQRLGSGIYLYRMTTGNYQKTKKVIMLK